MDLHLLDRATRLALLPNQTRQAPCRPDRVDDVAVGQSAAGQGQFLENPMLGTRAILCLGSAPFHVVAGLLFVKCLEYLRTGFMMRAA